MVALLDHVGIKEFMVEHVGMHLCVRTMFVNAEKVEVPQRKDEDSRTPLNKPLV